LEKLEWTIRELKMPLYEYHCAQCKVKKEAFRTLSEYDKAENCDACEIPMERILCAPAVIPDTPGYQSPISGKWVEGRVARREDLHKNHCRPWEGMEQENKEAKRIKDCDDKAFDKKIDESLSASFEQLASDKRRALSD
jgi:putative FmdB family regulatory protein